MRDLEEPGKARPDDAMLEVELAERWHCSNRSVQRWRSKGDIPRWFRIGRKVHYLRRDVLAFEAKRRKRREGS